MNKQREKQWLLGLPFVVGKLNELVQVLLEQNLDTGESRLLTIFTPNPEQVMLARRQPDFLPVLLEADWLVPDGMGLVWADRLLSWRLARAWRLRERVAGVDLMEELGSRAFKRGKNVFFLGGRGSVAAKAAEAVRGRFEKAGDVDGGGSVFGMSGPEDLRRATDGDWQAVWERLEQFRPHVLFVGFGAPEQEQWVVEHSSRLQACGVHIVMVVGGAFDMLAGEVQRAPISWRKWGFEWLWRLMQQPWRLWRQAWLLAFGLLVGWQVVVGAGQRTDA